VTALVCSENVTKQKPDETVHTCMKQTLKVAHEFKYKLHTIEGDKRPNIQKNNLRKLVFVKEEMNEFDKMTT
jgi:hypothetical protein